MQNTGIIQNKLKKHTPLHKKNIRIIICGFKNIKKVHTKIKFQYPNYEKENFYIHILSFEIRLLEIQFSKIKMRKRMGGKEKEK